MQPERRYAVTVLTGLAATALAIWLDAHGTIVVSIAALYAGTAYYATDHPDVMWGRNRRGPDWTAGALAAGMSFGMLGFVGVDAAPGVVMLGFGLVAFGFANGVAYGRQEQTGG